MDGGGGDSVERSLARREALRTGAATGAAGLLGVSSLMLPSAGAAASELGPAGVPTSSLVASLDASFPGGSPSTVWVDGSGNGNSGLPGTGVTFVAASGGVPAHYSFPGTSVTQRTTVGTGAIVGTLAAPPTAYTKMVWFRRDTLTKSSNLASSPSGDGLAAHFLYFVSTAAYARVTVGHNTGFDRLVSASTVTPGAWTFVAVAFSTVDGFRVHQNTSDRSWTTTASVETSAYDPDRDALAAPIAIDIGAFGGNVGNALDGDVATLVIHSRALGTAEVNAYYAATVDRFHPL